MPRKTPDRKRSHSKDEKARQSTPKKRSRTYTESTRSHSQKQREEQHGKRPKVRRKGRSTRNEFSEKNRHFEYQESSRLVRPRRTAEERKIREKYREQEQKKVIKSPGFLLFSYLGNLVFYGVIIGIILMSVMFSFSSKSTASIFGYRFYTVLTNSMAPQENGPKGGFFAGDIVIVKLMDGNKIKKDEIVTFAVGDGSRYLTHRMVERKEELNGEKGDYLVTKGDANKSNDPPITADRVLGKVVFVVPKVGSIIEFAREEFWACLVCILSLYGFLLVLKAYLFSSKEEPVRRKKRRQAYER